MATRKVEATIEIETAAERIIQAFTDSSMLHNWWGVERFLIEKKVGGLYSLVWGISENGMKYISTGTLKHFDPKGLLDVENFVYFNPEKQIFGPMTLKVQAQQNGKRCTVTVTQDGYQSGGDWDWYFEAVQQAWPTVLKTLKGYLEKTKT